MMKIFALTGDFGEEVIDLVADIASVEVSKAVVLGNHDAW